MSKEELIKELETLSDSCNSNYALYVNGYKSGIFDAIELINKYLSLNKGFDTEHDELSNILP